MNKIKFTVPGMPCGKGRARITKVGHAYTPEKTVLYENLVKLSFLGASQPNRQLWDGRIKAKITAYFPVPKSTSKKKHEAMLDDVFSPTVKPDTDNIAKICLDALNNTAYEDDKQVVCLLVHKIYSDTPRVEIELEEF